MRSVLITSCVLLLQLINPAQVPASAHTDLASLFTPRGLLLDRDGDGFPDGVRARLVLGDRAPGTVAAACELAARLGIETCALDGSLLESAQGPVLHVGLAPAGAGLAAGQGLVTWSEETLRVTGADPAGLGAAALLVAGWLPRLPFGEDLAARRAALAAEHAIGPEQAGTMVFASATVDADSMRCSLTVRLPGSDQAVEVVSAPSAGAAPRDGVPRGGKARRFGLQDIFGLKGLLSDSDGDLVPDGSAVTIVPSGEAGSEGAVDVALRLGLESAGLRFPIAASPGAIEPGKVKGPVVLVGADQPLVRDLAQRGLLPPLEGPAGTGEVRVVNGAFKKQAAVVVRGVDAPGLLRACRVVLERLPHLEPGRTARSGLSELATEARRFVAGISSPGQAARVRRSAEILLARENVADDSALSVAIEGLPADATTRDALFRHWKQVLPSEVTALEEVDPRRSDGQHLLLEQGWKLPWEVDRHRLTLARDVLPLLKAGQDVSIEVLVSEPREQRDQLRKEILQALARVLGNEPEHPPQVTVLSAWKPALSWLLEVVAPAARKQNALAVQIAAPLYTDRSGGRWSTLRSRARWFQELHPGIELLARALDKDPDQDISLVTLPERPPKGAVPDVHYEARLTLLDGSTTTLHFEPALRRAPFSAAFPGYESVVLDTGRMRCSIDGKRVLERLVETDLETVWRTYQQQVVQRLRDDLMDLSQGQPGSIRAPMFCLAQIHAECSEDDRALIIGKELSSPPEALYEEFYFHTLWSTSVVGQVYTGRPLRYPGRVVPDVVQKTGSGPNLWVRLLARNRGAPGIYTAGRLAAGPRRLLPRMKLDEPRVTSVRVNGAGRLAVAVRFHCEADEDDRAAWVRRASPRQVDRDMLAAGLGVKLVEELRILCGLGAWRDSFSLPGVERIEFEFAGPGGLRRAAIDVEPRKVLPPVPAEPEPGKALVPGRRAIGPDEAGALLGTLARDHGARVYHAGRSYLGRDLWTLETGPVTARHFSRRKLAAWKPVLLVSAREHANEVSSTNHVMQFLQESLADPNVTRRVTLVVNPVWNADGAALAITQARSHPDWMLHAGYLGALGENLSVGMNDPDPVQPEARVRLRLFRRHLPDVFLNPHGYPSHEWVQPFSGYAAWVRGREPMARDWWGARGWFLQHFTWPRGEKYAEQRKVAHAIRDRIVKKISALPAVMALNAEQHRRYMRYGAFDPDVYRVPLVDGVQVNGPITGEPAKKDSSNFALRHPKTCVFFGITEVPDETAHGRYLELVSSAGKAFDRAALEYLLESDPRLKTQVTGYRDGAVRKRARKRPALPRAGATAEPSGQ